MGGPGYLEKALKSIRRYIIGWFIFSGLLLIGLGWGLQQLIPGQLLMISGAMAGVWLLTSIIVGAIVASKVTKPLKRCPNL